MVSQDTFDNSKFLKPFKNFKITVTEQHINEFVAIDDESSQLYILEEANLCFQDQGAVNKYENLTSDEDEPMYADSQRLQARNTLDGVYAKSVIQRRELSSAGMQTAVGNKYEKLKFTFNNF